MIVRVSDYGDDGDKKFIEYSVRGLSSSQMTYLDENLEEDTSVVGEDFNIRMLFTQELYPFQSEVSKIRIDDFIAREEIEMNIFLSSFLEDM